MILYVEELRAGALEQTFSRETTALVERVRLHLCKFLSPAGTFTLSLLDDADNVLATKSQTLAEMQAAGSIGFTENYYHGHVSFIWDRSLTLRPGVYKLQLTSSGYTYDPDEFIGWVKATHDRAIPITGDEEPAALSDSPYDFEIFSLERIR
jgi:hypothetical protein